MAQMQRMSIYANGLKIAEVMKAKVDINTGGEPIDIQDGVGGGTQGNLKINVSFDVAIFLGMPGGSGAIFDNTLKQEEIEVATNIGGQLLQFPFMFSTASFDSDNANGKITGAYAGFSTGQPKKAA